MSGEYILRRDTRPYPSCEKIDAIAQWFPGATETRDDQLHALRMILDWARREFGPECNVQPTPTLFGCMLLERSLPKDHQYPAISDGRQRLLHAIAFPHRMEVFAPGFKRNSKDAYQYDGRIMFLGQCGNVAVHIPGQETYDQKDQYEAYRQGWYQVDLTVPADWRRIGLVPLHENDRITYPRQPGQEFRTWAHESEMRLMVKYGWPFAIRSRFLFAPDGAGARPLRNWKEKISTAIEKIDHPSVMSPALKLARAGLRSLALHTIGRFHHNARGGPTFITAEDGSAEEIEYPPLTPFTARWHHPEWSASIWARARVQATLLALKAPHSDLRMIDGDAVYSATPLAVEDDGKVGSFRPKGLAVNAGAI